MTELPKVVTRFSKHTFTTDEITDKGIDLRKVAVGDFIAAAERDLNT